MFLGAYELCRILTKDKRKISLVGAIAITFSGAVQWWYCMDTLIWGQLILVLVNKFFATDKRWVKYLCAVGLVSVLLSYVFVLYPAWQVSFAYVLLALVIFILITNIKNGYKFNVHDVLVIIATVLVVVGFLVYWYNTSKEAITLTMNTDYPGARMEVGGGSLIQYSYVYNIFFAFKDAFNPCEASSMLSFYPIPMVLALVYLVANRKDKETKQDLIFIVPAMIVAAILTIWCKWGFPEIIAKLSLMSMTTVHRASIALGTLNIYILIYLFGRTEDGKEDKNRVYLRGVRFIQYRAFEFARAVQRKMRLFDRRDLRGRLRPRNKKQRADHSRRGPFPHYTGFEMRGQGGNGVHRGNG